MKQCKSCFRLCENDRDAAAKGLPVRERQHGLARYSYAPRKGVKTRCCAVSHASDGEWSGENFACAYHKYRWQWNLSMFWTWRVYFGIRDLWRRFIAVPIGLLRKPLPVEWETEFDEGVYPVCPHCGEFSGNLEHCDFCGQRFVQDERLIEYATPPEVKYMDCLMCGGKGTVAYTEAKSNGHKHGKCSACGARFME